MVEKSGEAVVWGSPKSQVGAFLDDFKLVCQGSCEFLFVSLDMATYFSQSFGLHLRNAIFDVG